jgi:N-acetylmuramate 1-kinase
LTPWAGVFIASPHFPLILLKEWGYTEYQHMPQPQSSEPSHRELAQRLLERTAAFKRARIQAVEALTGDASPRQYVRLRLQDAPQATLILMLLSHGFGPVSAGPQLSQDDTYVELSAFFKRHRIPVPGIVCDGRDLGALLVEDAGDLPLWRFSCGELNQEGLQVKEGLGQATVFLLYRRAVDVIAAIQRIDPNPECRALQRCLGVEQYQEEALRFIHFFLTPQQILTEELPLIEGSIERLCESVAAHPRRVVHRDFMPWNIHVAPGGGLTVLDFQDALLGSFAYDIISLIHDRDADFALGKETCLAVRRYFIQQLGLGHDFHRSYNEALLQRHLRLAGQFCRLTQTTGNPIYQAWVPGCLKRIGRALAALPDLHGLLDRLCTALPEVRAGADDPWEP